MKRFFEILIEIGEQVPFKIGDDAIISIEGTYNPNASLWPIILIIMGCLLFPYIIAAFFYFLLLLMTALNYITPYWWEIFGYNCAYCKRRSHDRGETIAIDGRNWIMNTCEECRDKPAYERKNPSDEQASLVEY